VDTVTGFLRDKYGIDESILALAAEAEAEVEGVFAGLDEICAYNQYKVANAFRISRISEHHFNQSTGYGYNDSGRAAVEKVYSEVFGTESALVRTQIVNGTHAISISFSGILRPGDELIYCTGTPYDTIHGSIGLTGSDMGSLKDFGISYRQIELKEGGGIDFEALKGIISPKTRMLCLQRAAGYSDRKAIAIDQIAVWADFMKTEFPDIILMVDNCYGEFTSKQEPSEVGVDLIAGSLIKNPGGGLAFSGGYVCGKADLIEKISYRLTCPGIGGECGLSFGQNRNILQGLYLAPKVVNGALKGAVLCARLFEKLGYKVNPAWDEERSDIIETLTLGSADALIKFCEGVQEAAPVDSFVRPEPCEMPGYEDEVIMAAGAFIQGSSIELSADGPLRPPYNVFFQGGLSYEYSKLGVLMAAQKLLEAGLINNLDQSIKHL